MHFTMQRNRAEAAIPITAVPTKSKLTAGRVGSVHDFWAASVNRNGSDVSDYYSSGNFRKSDCGNSAAPTKQMRKSVNLYSARRS